MKKFLHLCRVLLAMLLLASLSVGCATVKSWPDRIKNMRKPAASPSSSTANVTAPPVAPPLAVTAKPAPVVVAQALPQVKVPDPVVAHRAPYRLRPGDPIIIYLRGIMPKDDQIEEVVDDTGMITLPYIDNVLAVNKTSSELEREIQRLYIERKIYRSVTVNVVMPSQSYFIQGEVRSPQRFPLLTGTTLLQAIAAAGGYSEFANPKAVTLTRGKDVRVFNMREIERDPRRDISIESGDVIRVPRSIF